MREFIDLKRFTPPGTQCEVSVCVHPVATLPSRAAGAYAARRDGATASGARRTPQGRGTFQCVSPSFSGLAWQPLGCRERKDAAERSIENVPTIWE